MTFEEVEQHVASCPCPELKSGASVGLADVCGMYHSARPVLVFAIAMLFWAPQAWKDRANQLLAVLDSVCPLQ